MAYQSIEPTTDAVDAQTKPIALALLFAKPLTPVVIPDGSGGPTSGPGITTGQIWPNGSN